jgi:hypothetical protein
MPEWLKGHDWKSCVPTKSGPRVQIPLSPPSCAKPLRLAASTTPKLLAYNKNINLVDSRVLRNKRLQTPSGPEGSSGSNPLCVPQGCLTINKLSTETQG